MAIGFASRRLIFFSHNPVGGKLLIIVNMRLKVMNNGVRSALWFLIYLILISSVGSKIAGCTSDTPMPREIKVRKAIPVEFKPSMRHWWEVLNELNCPPISQDSQYPDATDIKILDDKGNLLTTVPAPKGKPEVIATKPIKVECFYSFSFIVPYSSKYQIEGINGISIVDYNDLRADKWEINQAPNKPLTDEILNR